MGTGSGSVGRAGLRAGQAALTALSSGRLASGPRGLRTPRSRPASIAPVLALALAAATGPAAAQEQLARRCVESLGGVVASAAPECLLLAQAADIAQARWAAVTSGGDPVAGSASTIGTRPDHKPRLSGGLRVTGIRVALPAPSRTRTSLFAPAIAADGAIGLFNGLSSTSDVAGVGSLDLLAGIGVVPGAGHGFHGAAATGAVGARLGLLRESFNVPGVSISGMVRRIGGFGYGERSSATGIFLGEARLEHTTDVSLRAVAGKRLSRIGTLVGAGLDRPSSPVLLRRGCSSASGCAPTEAEWSVSGRLDQTRAIVFGDLTWTSLVFNVVGEIGWQGGGSPARTTATGASLPSTGYEDLVRRGGVFASLALRLTV